MDSQNIPSKQIPVANDEEVRNFIARFYPHLVEAPQVRALTVKEALQEQAKIASGELSAEEMMTNDIMGIMIQGGLTPDIMRLQAEAKPWPGTTAEAQEQERDQITHRVRETQEINKNPTPSLRNMVRRQFGLPPKE